MYKIQTGDLRITDAEKKAIMEVLNSNKISEGPKVAEFEKLWAKYIGTKHCILTNSGTSALIVGLRALDYLYGIKGEIATTPFTYIATTNSILLTGNTPVYVDIEYETFGMSPEELEKTLEQNPYIKAVMPVSIMGVPCQIDKIKEIADKYNIPVIHDLCQAYGTKYKGKMLGSESIFSACSFFIAHTLQCSELGSIQTNDSDLLRVMNKLKSNGRTSTYDVEKEEYYRFNKEGDERDFHPRYYHDMISGNYRTTEFSATLAIEQFKTIDWIIKTRNNNVKYLNDHLKKYEEIIQLPKYDKDIAYLGYSILIKKPEVISRKQFRTKLEKFSIETRPLYGCLPLDMPSLKEFAPQYKGKLLNAQDIGRNTFYIGCHQFLSKEDLDYIIQSIEEILRGT